MRTQHLTVCVAGDIEPPSTAIDALLADARHAVVVPWIDRPGTNRSGRGPALGPSATLRAWRAGRIVGPPGDTPTVSLIAAPTELLDAVGGPDPRFATPVGWADLVTRLRTIDPDLPVVDAEAGVAVTSIEADRTRFTTDLHLHAANRPSFAWRITARLVRPASAAARAPSTLSSSQLTLVAEK